MYVCDNVWYTLSYSIYIPHHTSTSSSMYKLSCTDEMGCSWILSGHDQKIWRTVSVSINSTSPFIQLNTDPPNLHQVEFSESLTCLFLESQVQIDVQSIFLREQWKNMVLVGLVLVQHYIALWIDNYAVCKSMIVIDIELFDALLKSVDHYVVLYLHKLIHTLW